MGIALHVRMENLPGPHVGMLTTLKVDYHEQEGPQAISFSAGAEQYNLSTLDINQEIEVPLTAST